MTIDQIRYFIATAKCLNFTKAADQLYISQSTLSRQIKTIEYELNMQLFRRSQRYVILTPAGKYLLEHLEKIHNDFTEIVSEAKMIQKGYTGRLNIGVLEGAIIDDIIPRGIHFLKKTFPQVEIDLSIHSFNGLIKGIYDGTLDLAFTLYFDIVDRNNIMFKIIEKTKDYLVVPRCHWLSDKNDVSLLDVKEEVFIILDQQDSEKSVELIVNACMSQGFYPNVKYSPSLQTSMLWVQAGIGVTILDGRNQLFKNSSVSFKPIMPISDPSFCVAWTSDNVNPFREPFINYITEKLGQ